MLTPHQGFTYNKFDKPNDWPELSSTFDYKIEDGKLFSANENIKLSGPVSYSKVGSPTITDGVASGFSSSDYLRLSQGIDISKEFEWVFKIHTTSDTSVSSDQRIVSYLTTWINSIYLSGSNQYLRWWIATDGEQIGGTTAPLAFNTDYWIKAVHNNGVYTLSYSTDGTNYTTVASKTATYTGISNYTDIGVNHTNYYSPFQGSIDLNETYIKVNGALWFGQKHRQYQSSNGVVTKNTVPVPEGLVIGNFTTPSNGMFDITTQTFEPFEYYPIIKTDSNMLQVESIQYEEGIKPESKLVGPIGYTVVGSPTINNGVVSGFSENNYLETNTTFNPMEDNWEILTKIRSSQSQNSGVFSIGSGAYSLGLNIYSASSYDYLFRVLAYSGSTTYLLVTTGSKNDFVPNVDYWVKIRKSSNVVYLSYSTNGYNFSTEQSGTIEGTIPTGNVVFGRYVFNGKALTNGSIDLNNTYIKLNNTLWFGKENWTPCIFDDNSIVELVGHKADYSSYNTYALQSAIQNSGTYDVWIDNQKVFENITSTQKTNINWSNLALTTGYSVTTPEALKAHIVKITPSNKSNKFTGFRNTVSSYTSTGTEYTGVLQIHFELDYELELQYLTTQQVSPTTQSKLLYAVTSKTNELITSSISNSFASTQVRRIPKIKSSDGFINMSRAFAFIQNSLKYANIDSGLLQYYVFSQSNALEKLDGNYEVGSNATAVLQQVPALKQLPNISNITSVNLTNFVTNASSLQPTDVDLSNKDDLTKLDIYGSSSNRIDGLKSLKVSNEAPFTGTSPQINVSYTGLERNALVELFNSLPYNVGYTVVGSPTITDGVVSGFSTDDYLTLSSNTIPTNSAVEIKIRIKTPPSASTDVFVGFGAVQTVCWLSMVEGTNKIAFRASSYSGAITFVSATVNFNTEYDILLKYYKGTYTTLGIKLPSETEYQTTTGDILFDESAYEYIDNYFVIRMLGRATSTAYPRPLNGSIDLNNTYIKVNGVPWFRGTAAMTKTIDITGCTGTNSLTNDDLLIATNKGWTVTGAS